MQPWRRVFDRRWPAWLLRVLRWMDRDAVRGRLGALVGAAGGALYTLDSRRHMVVPGAHDVLIVGVILSGIGAGAGWLAGHLLDRPESHSAATVAPASSAVRHAIDAKEDQP